MRRRISVPYRVRYRTSRTILSQSFALLRRERDLWVLAAASGLLFLLMMAGVAAFVAWDLDSDLLNTDPVMVPLKVLLVLPLLYPFQVVISVVQSALAFCLHERMEGRTCTRRDGLRRAIGQLGPIARFSLVGMAVTGVFQAVGILLDKLRLVPYLGQVFQSVGALAWAAASFFVIPLLVVERERSAVAAVRASAGIARDQWGTAVSGVLTIGLAVTLPLMFLVLLVMLPMPFLLLQGMDVATLMLVQGGVFLLVVAFASTVGQTATTAYQVALYRFARSGGVTPPYTHETLRDAWEPYRA